MLAVGIPFVTAAPSAAATALSATPRTPMIAETTRITGRLTTAVARPIRLQYLNGTRWVTLKNAKSASTGRFSLAIRQSVASRKYRVHAPRTTRHGAQNTGTIVIRAVRQTAAVSFMRAPVGQSADGAQRDLLPGQGRFTPTRRGRAVFLQRYAGGTWQTVASARQDARGMFTFNAAPGSAYRVRAAGFNGAPAVNSAKVTPAVAAIDFADEFNGTALDSSKWGIRQEGERRDASNRPCSESSSKSVSVSDGAVHFQVKQIDQLSPDYGADEISRQSQCPHGQYFNAHIGTQGKYAFQYGVMAAKVKFAREDGQHGAFWSQPDNSAGTEIDAVEYFGDSRTRAGFGSLQHSIYWQQSGKQNYDKVNQSRDYLLGRDKTWWNSYHVFSVERKPGVYIFRIDGHETFRTTKGLTAAQQYLILSLLTSTWELDELQGWDKSNLSTMDIDWVRVWKP